MMTTRKSTSDIGDQEEHTSTAPAGNTVDAAPDPFDLQAVREQADDAEIRTRKVLLSLPVRKPAKHEFLRVHPGPEFMIDAYVVEHEEGLNQVLYWVAPSLTGLLRQLPEVLPSIRRVRLHYCVSRRGVHFLWPLKLPAADGANSGRAWSESALEVAGEAMKSWVRLAGNQDSGRYEMFVAEGDLGEPAWLEFEFRELISLGFKGRVIEDEDHEVLQELFGRM